MHEKQIQWTNIEQLIIPSPIHIFRLLHIEISTSKEFYKYSIALLIFITHNDNVKNTTTKNTRELAVYDRKIMLK